MVEERMFDAYEKVPGEKKKNEGVLRTFMWVEGTSL